MNFILMIDGDFFQPNAAIKIIYKYVTSRVLKSNIKKLLAKVFILNTQSILMMVNNFIKFCLLLLGKDF